MAAGRSRFRYLGFLGLLGLLGLATNNPGFAGFFGFFGFFAWGNLIEDERLRTNVNRAAANAFVAAVVAFPVFILYGVFGPVPAATVYAIGFAVTFGIQMATFGLSLAIYER